jgi:hypothetical protein
VDKRAGAEALENKSLSPLLGIEARCFSNPDHSLVIRATELSWLLRPHAYAYEALSQFRKLVLLRHAFKSLSHKQILRL